MATITAIRPSPAARDDVAALRHWQQTLADFLLHRDARDNAKADAKVDSDAAALNRLLRPSARNEAAKRIYRNNVLHSLTEALADQFPAACRMVGERFFNGLAREFVLAYPPRDPALTFYGREFADFVGANKHCQSLPWLSDLARLEYLCQLSRFAADEPDLDTAALGATDPQRLLEARLKTLQSVYLLRSPWPVHRFREEALKDDPQRVESESAGDFCLLVYRRRMRERVVEMQSTPFILLQSLREGLSIGEAWGRVPGADSLPPQRLTEALAYLLGMALFTTFVLED